MLVNIGQAQNTRAIDCYVSDLNVRSTTSCQLSKNIYPRHVFIDRSSVAHTFAKREQEPTPHMIFLHRSTIHSSHLPPRTCEYQLGIAAATPQTFRTPARPSLRVTWLQLLMTSRRSAGNSGSGATVSYACGGYRLLFAQLPAARCVDTKLRVPAMLRQAVDNDARSGLSRLIDGTTVCSDRPYHQRYISIAASSTAALASGGGGPRDAACSGAACRATRV